MAHKRLVGVAREKSCKMGKNKLLFSEKALGCSWRKPLQAKPKPVFEKNVQELLKALCN